MTVKTARIVTLEQNQLIIKFSGPSFAESLKLVKSLDGREFVKDKGFWIAPNNENNFKALKDAGFEMPQIISIKKELPKIDKSLFEGFRDYQIDGVTFLESVNGQGMLNDDMGIGKTIQAIGYAKLHPEIRPILVICPASIKLNWAYEIKKWLNEDAYILSGEKPEPILQKGFKWYIINYDILAYNIIQTDPKNNKARIVDIEGWINKLPELNIRGIIVDEFQFISNTASLRTRAVTKAKKTLFPKMFIGLSGTPMRNRPADLFPMLSLLNPLLFSNRWKYLWRYCGPKNNGFGWTFTGATNTEELHDKISPMMIRRVKSDVLKELPPKQKIIVPMELNGLDEDEYLKADREFIAWLKENTKNGINVQTQVEKLKQLAYLAKRNSIIQWISDYLSSGNKLVVFTYHKKALADIYSQFKKIAVTLDGSTPAKDRKEIVDRFQKDDKIKLFIGQIQAAGIGITLTAANACAFAEFGYSPFDHEQAEDRINRIGQNADSITAYYLLNEDSIEKDIMDLLTMKYNNVSKVLDGKSNDDFFQMNIANEVIKKYRKKLA
jgi:SWI/SNF-related matrix-associated actin-dependent regulator of chromatin subfamily A-like protein 1